jgi:hypothetical protein
LGARDNRIIYLYKGITAPKRICLRAGFASRGFKAVFVG